MKRVQFTVAATLGIAGALLLSLSAPGRAESAYPNRPINMMVPAAAGGPSDTVARLVGEAMSADLGQRVIIENVGGAGGSIGAGRVAKASPDGYSLLLYHIGVSTFSALYPKLPYNPGEAFESIGLVTEVPLIIVSRKDLAPNNMASLLDWLKGKGAGTTFGTAGVGAASDLCGRLLTDATGVKLTLVPYKGTGPAMNDLVGGQIDVMCDQSTNTVNQIEAGQIKAYAVTTRERVKVLPNLPTLAESGLKGFDLSAWHAIWVPRGTPEAIKQRLAASLQKALVDSRVIERFAALGTAPVSAAMASPAALDERFKSEIARWNKLLAGVAEK